MTDSHPPASHQPQQRHIYEGFDPEFPEEQEEEAAKKAARVNTVQVGASAAAAVTSALVASFFGVAGTLIGAAVGSIVSTVAGALYADYLRKASTRLRDTRAVVVQRLPTEALTTTPLRHLTGPLPARDPADPTAVPGGASLQPVQQQGEETVVVPLATAKEIRRASTSFDPTAVISGQHLSETQLIPRITAETLTQPSVTQPSVTSTNATTTQTAVAGGTVADGHAPTIAPSGASTSGPGTGDPGQRHQLPAGPGPRPWWKRPPVMLGAVGAACFVIAVGVVTVIELGIGHPLSDSHVKGTSLSRTVEGRTSSKSRAPAPTGTGTVTPSASATQPTATATPSATATGTPTPTATSTPTSSPTGQSTSQPTGTTPAPSTQGARGPVASKTP